MFPFTFFSCSLSPSPSPAFFKRKSSAQPFLVHLKQVHDLRNTQPFLTLSVPFSLFLVFYASFSSMFSSSKLIFFVMSLFILPSFSISLLAIVDLSLFSYLSPPPSPSYHISVSSSILKPCLLCCKVRLEYACRSKHNYLKTFTEKKQTRLSVLSDFLCLLGSCTPS